MRNTYSLCNVATDILQSLFWFQNQWWHIFVISFFGASTVLTFVIREFGTMIPLVLLINLHIAQRGKYTSWQVGGYCRFIFTPRVFNWCALAENSICVAKYSRISEPMAKVCSTGMVVVSSTGSVRGEFLLKFVLVTSKKVWILCWYWNHIIQRKVGRYL